MLNPSHRPAKSTATWHCPYGKPPAWVTCSRPRRSFGNKNLNCYQYPVQSPDSLIHNNHSTRNTETQGKVSDDPHSRSSIAEGQRRANQFEDKVPREAPTYNSRAEQLKETREDPGDSKPRQTETGIHKPKMKAFVKPSGSTIFRLGMWLCELK